MRYTIVDVRQITGWSLSKFLKVRQTTDFPQPVSAEAKPFRWRVPEVENWIALHAKFPNTNERDRNLMRLFPIVYETAFRAALSAPRTDIGIAWEAAIDADYQELKQAIFNTEENTWVSAELLECAPRTHTRDILSFAREKFESEFERSPSRQSLWELAKRPYLHVAEHVARREAHAAGIEAARKAAGRNLENCGKFATVGALISCSL